MKYDEIEDKELFKSWLGIEDIKVKENVELGFYDWECFHCLVDEFLTEDDLELSSCLDDMNLIITHETFEQLVDEYDLALDLKDSLVVLS